MTTLNATHDPQRRSWVASANAAGTDFPIQNLPFGRFRRTGRGEPWRIGVAIGDQVFDLKRAAELGDWPADVTALPACAISVLRSPLASGASSAVSYTHLTLPTILRV